MSSHKHLGVVIGHDGNRLYGFDAELFLKMEAKRDRKWEHRILEWIQDVVGEKLADLDDVWVSLKSGVILCKLANRLKPNIIPKISTTRLVALVERDNIDLFLQACWKLGVPSSEMFNTSDLYNRKAITQVYSCLAALSKLSPKLGWKGAVLKESSANSKAAQQPTKKWAEVQAVVPGGMTRHADDLVEGGDSKRILELELRLAEVSKESKRLQADRVGAKQELEG